MTKKTYFEKLKDPRWQKKRLEMLELREWRCEICYDGEQTLHVHHKAYFKGREPWEYDTNQLAVLCESCHTAEHESDVLADAVSRIHMDGPTNREQMGYFLQGALGLAVELPHKAAAIAYILGGDFEARHSALCSQIKDENSPISKQVAAMMEGK